MKESMDHKMRVLQIGLGPIGALVTRYLVERDAFEIVGAVDSDPDKVGLELGDLAELREPLGLRIAGDVASALRNGQADVAVLTTTSSIERAAPQIEALLARGLPIVSTCEELAYPWRTHPDLARRIDEAAREAGVAVLGTGVNPGFLMDLLPLVLTGVCQRVLSITVERIQDASIRRLPFQRKIGAGLSPAEFEGRVQAGTLRHVGLTESMHMIAGAIGWELDRTEETIAPVIAQNRIETADLVIEPGQAQGVQQFGYGYRKRQRLISLIFRAAVGEPESYEHIVIRGTPEVDLHIANGINGDVATGAIVVNAVRAIRTARPGLRTMADMPPVTYSVR